MATFSSNSVKQLFVANTSGTGGSGQYSEAVKTVDNEPASAKATVFDICEKTVRNHISNVMQKLNVKSRSAAIIELLKLGEISL